MFVSRRRTAHYAFRITCPAMYCIVLPTAIVTTYNTFSWATVVITAHGLTVNDYVTVMPVHTTEKEKSRKVYTGRPIYIAMLVIAYVMTPAYRGSRVPPVAIYHMGVVIRYIHYFSPTRLNVNDLSAAFTFCLNFNIVVGY